MRPQNRFNKYKKNRGQNNNQRRQGPPRRNNFNSNSPRRDRQAPDMNEKEFFAKMAVDPSPRIRLEDGSSELTVRAMDLLCPIGRGQRGLIVAPPKTGKTTFLKHLCQAIGKAAPDIKLYALLIDERPEEVTDFRRSVPAEVRFSTSDQPYDNHIRVAKELMKQAVAEANEGKDVMILLDSLTRLARVHNSATRGVGRTLSGGVDSEGLLIPRRIFGSARKIENGGSLGILATILVQTNSRMDEVIFQEFKGTGNMELVLSRQAAERRVFPAINVRESGTRREELLLSETELNDTRVLRSALAGMDEVNAAQTLVDQLAKTPNNESFLTSFRR